MGGNKDDMKGSVIDFLSEAKKRNRKTSQPHQQTKSSQHSTIKITHENIQAGRDITVRIEINVSNDQNEKSDDGQAQ